MTKHEFKPGDVALVLNEHGVWNVAICAVRARHGIVWVYGVADSWMPLTADARPLVVLDPDDREQVKRLTDWMSRNGWTGLDDDAPDDMAEALRSLVSPPRPPEPQGLGAVVEDEQGGRWSRSGLRSRPWVSEETADRELAIWADYEDVAVVRVLSAGVQ